MSLLITDLKLPLDADERALYTAVAKTLSLSIETINNIRVVRLALDARKKSDIRLSYSLLINLNDSDEAWVLKKKQANVSPAYDIKKEQLIIGSKSLYAPIVIVGFGPAGMFAAYTLAKHGYKPVVIERGKDIDSRSEDVEKFFNSALLSEESNVMFGEGGAGAFSDGKLTTRIKDPRSMDILETLVKFGAPDEILIQAKPHVGTDVLRAVVKRLRTEIISQGGEVRFNTKLTGIAQSGGRICGVYVQHNGGIEKIQCSACILAVGQGARDTYNLLRKMNMELAPKAFAVGVRIEHPQHYVDKTQYGRFLGHPRLGAAEYRMAGKSNNRGVYTFCMCPGGVVIGSSSSTGQVVTNGMSYYARDGVNANSAIVVSVNPSDFGFDAMEGVRFQEDLERQAFALGGSDFTAPAERLIDFMRGTRPTGFSVVKPTYRPGVKTNDISKCLPDFVSAGVKEGVGSFSHMMKGFDMPDAVLTAVETRTSSPLRILRNENGEAARMGGLYPVGEGAGYAGGIVSAAVDGIKAAERLIKIYRPVI